MKTQKKRIAIICLILIILIVSYCIVRLNCKGIHFIGNYGKFKVEKEYTLYEEFINEEEQLEQKEIKKVNVKINGSCNGLQDRFSGVIEVEGFDMDLPHNANFGYNTEKNKRYSIAYGGTDLYDKSEKTPKDIRYSFLLEGKKNKGEKINIRILDYKENKRYIVR